MKVARKTLLEAVADETFITPKSYEQEREGIGKMKARWSVLNSQGFPNPALLSTLHNWLPHDALHLASVPLVDRTSSGETGEATLQGKVEYIFSAPVEVNAGDCVVVLYSRSGNGATDNETQVHALMAP
jgi:hypothetical protein